VRIVSLSPGITESVIALGAQSQLVGVSDYCELPPTLHAPRVGSAITPNYEAIARLTPDLILATQVAGTQLNPLGRLAPTHALPWLAQDEVQASLLQLGHLLDRTQAANALVQRFITTLRGEPSPDAPRVLWVLDWGDDSATTTWFIRDNSLHGAVLRAAGLRNAVPDPVSQPTLSVEQLLKVDPDVIVQVLSAPHLDDAQIAHAQQRLQQHFARLTPLRAVRAQHLQVVHHPGAMNLGPGVLDLVRTLRMALKLYLAPQLPAP
jgi:iron complex transport system substrate-binding protein